MNTDKKLVETDKKDDMLQWSPARLIAQGATLRGSGVVSAFVHLYSVQFSPNFIAEEGLLSSGNPDLDD